MGLIDNETFLPGVITEVESDYSYGYDSSQFGTTDSIVIIGTAFSGPVGKPIEIYSPEHARYIFGGAYSSKSKVEASLVPAIEDAYQRGARTIYAMRVSGTPVSKDFEFALDNNLRLRITSSYPTNDAKDFYLVYDATDGDERIKIYKPASKATIVEKKLGMVESDNAVIVNEIRINRDYAITKDSRLVDLLDLVNNYAYNNVLKMQIVNEDGVVVTNSSIEAQSLTVGALLQGAYMIGHSESICRAVTEIEYQICLDDKDKPFESFEGVVYKKIKLNTDVNTPYPIGALKIADIRAVLKEVGIFNSKPFDFLETSGLADRAFKKDNVDYEEANLSSFELYKRLGSGFATTAKAIRRTTTATLKDKDGKDMLDAEGNTITYIKELTPRIVETPVSDNNRTETISDGIYSMLENMNAKYRIVAGVYANTSINGKLPRPKDFQVASPMSVDIANNLITATPIINESEIEITKPKEYMIQVEGLKEFVNADISQLCTTNVMKVVPLVEDPATELNGAVIESGSKILAKDDTGEYRLYSYSKLNGYVIFDDASLTDTYLIVEQDIYRGVNLGGRVAFRKVESPQLDDVNGTIELDGKAFHFVLGENNGHIFAFEVIGSDPSLARTVDVMSGKQVGPLGDIETMLSDEEEKMLVYSQSNFFEVNPIVIRSSSLDAITLEEFVEMLNEHSSLNRIFSFSIAEDAYDKKDDYVLDLGEDDPATVAIRTSNDNDLFFDKDELSADREIAYDYSKYIPYKTPDNFARQLAQHCTYTSLKTASTHGIIGLRPLVDTSLNSIAKHVADVSELEFDLYAKTNSGRNMLDRNNMPYPIGKNVSITEMQYNVYMDDGYAFVSNGSAGYAGMVSQLPLDQSSTNQPINISSLNYELTNYQLTKLTQKGFITVKQSYTKGLVVTDGITMAPSDSPFRRLNVTRIIGLVETLIREAAEPFIGKQNHDANRNSLQTAIKSNLEKIKGTLIEDYTFNLVLDRSTLKFAYIDVDYDIVPIYEIREVRNRITVKDQL